MKIDFRVASEAIARASETGGFISIGDYHTGADVDLNEYCLFIKPELTGATESFERVFGLIQDRLKAFDQTVVAAAAMGSGYMVRHNIMSQHYGVIDAISQTGQRAMSAVAVERLNEVFGEQLQAGMRLLGADEFLEEYPYFTAQALAVFYDNMSNVKLAGGTHCVKVIVRGQSVLLFNGFHPEQLERYTISGASILCLILRSRTPWKSLRNELTGATNPAKAVPGSIRQSLYVHRAELGLDEVSSGKNGIHLSAGPVEGMAEVMRFMSDLDSDEVIRAEDTTFGQLLSVSGGLSDTEIEKLSHNPVISVGGEQIPVFDATEELDAESALNVVVAARDSI